MPGLLGFWLCFRTARTALSEQDRLKHCYGGTDTSVFLAMNPNGTVLVLRDGDYKPLWETGANKPYLAAHYGGTLFWPAEGLVRAGSDKWAESLKINVALNFTAPIFWQVVRTAPASHDAATISRAVEALGKMLDIAEPQLSRVASLRATVLPRPTSSSGTCCFATLRS